MPRINLTTEITPLRFAEIGRLTGGTRSTTGDLVALTSEFPSLSWKARRLLDSPRHRLSLYDGSLVQRIAVFDAARFPINDVSIHPTLPILAIGTGCYDGGWSYRGELLFWNWKSGACRSAFDESREVLRCRFDSDDRLSVLLRPRDESNFVSDEYEALEDEEGELCVGTRLDGLVDWLERSTGRFDDRLKALTPCVPASFEFSELDDVARRRALLASLTEEARAAFEERVFVWDLTWVSDDALAVVHEGCHAEVWSTNGDRTHAYSGEGHGIQLLRIGPDTWVHILLHPRAADRSVLKRLSPSGLVDGPEFDRTYLFSVSRAGTVLGRDTGSPVFGTERADLLLSLDENTTVRANLGEYDSIHHYLRLDGGDGHYSLQGTPPDEHYGKNLVSWSPGAEPRTITAWDDEGERFVHSSACWAPDGDIVRAYSAYPSHQTDRASCIERLDLDSGLRRWRCEVSGVVTAMEPVWDANLVVCAMTDGTLATIDFESGSMSTSPARASDDLPIVITALSARGARLAAGTLDARVLLYELSSTDDQSP